MYGLRAFKQGKTRHSQLLMRGRIFAQGFTVVAIIFGVFTTAAKSKPWRPSTTHPPLPLDWYFLSGQNVDSCSLVLTLCNGQRYLLFVWQWLYYWSSNNIMSSVLSKLFFLANVYINVPWWHQPCRMSSFSVLGFQNITPDWISTFNVCSRSCCSLLKTGSKTCFCTGAIRQVIKNKIKACLCKHGSTGEGLQTGTAQCLALPRATCTFTFPLNILQHPLRWTWLLHRATGFAPLVSELKPYLLREQTPAQQAVVALCSPHLTLELPLLLLLKFHRSESFHKIISSREVDYRLTSKTKKLLCLSIYRSMRSIK